MITKKVRLSLLDTYLASIPARNPGFDALLARTIDHAEYWGPRCTEFEPDCSCCRAWDIFDKHPKLSQAAINEAVDASFA